MTTPESEKQLWASIRQGRIMRNWGDRPHALDCFDRRPLPPVEGEDRHISDQYLDFDPPPAKARCIIDQQPDFPLPADQVLFVVPHVSSRDWRKVTVMTWRAFLMPRDLAHIWMPSEDAAVELTCWLNHLCDQPNQPDLRCRIEESLPAPPREERLRLRGEFEVICRLLNVPSEATVHSYTRRE